MQVAGSSDIARAKLQYAAAVVSQVRIHRQTNIHISDIKTISSEGLRALAYIAQSTKLSVQDKKTLTRLVALVDEFAGGDPKLMRAIIGIAKIMEMGAKQSYPRQSIREALQEYFEEREKLRPGEDVHISIETQINAVSVQYTGMTLEAVVESADQGETSITTLPT